jgi:hypothetical protein
MPDLSEKGKGQLVTTGKLTTIGGAALAIIFVQTVALNAAWDIVMSAVIFGTGYLAGRITR